MKNKMKTKKAMAKRFRFSANGKVKFKRATKRHILSFRSSSNKLKLRAGGYLNPSDVQKVELGLPYGSVL